MHYGPFHAKTYVMFVHGFCGSAAGTWGKFPALLHDDPNLGAIYILPWEYKTSLLRCPGIKRVSELMRSQLFLDALRCDNVVLVAHSTGGLVSLQTTTKELIDGKGLDLPTSRIEGIALFATPLEGRLVKRTLGWILGGPIGFLWKHLVSNGQLKDILNEEFVTELRNAVMKRIYQKGLARDSRSERRIPIHSFVAEADKVVTEAAVKGWFDDPPPTLIPDTNHTTLKQPTNRKAPAYRHLRRVLDEVCDPWFRKLVSKASHSSSAYLNLRRTFDKCFRVRILRAVPESKDWEYSRIDLEHERWMIVFLKHAKQHPDMPIAELLANTMSLVKRRFRHLYG